MKTHAIIEKAVGETPLSAIERFRTEANVSENTPLAYAGRLDPMASGKLLVLIGEECKRQKHYHKLDKEYQFSILFGTTSDTGDVLGLLDWKKSTLVDKQSLESVCKKLTGVSVLPYPKFSSKTVQGKPLHVWTLENKLDEIEIPTTNTYIYKLKVAATRSVSAKDVYQTVIDKIETIPPVTEESKKLGADFRRKDVRLAWQVWYENHKGTEVQIADLVCLASSGTYMRSLAEEIGKQLDHPALAYSIHRTEIGKYRKILGFGWWQKKL